MTASEAIEVYKTLNSRQIMAAYHVQTAMEDALGLIAITKHAGFINKLYEELASSTLLEDLVKT